jgi:hypothetical protein
MYLVLTKFPAAPGMSGLIEKADMKEYDRLRRIKEIMEEREARRLDIKGVPLADRSIGSLVVAVPSNDALFQT